MCIRDSLERVAAGGPFPMFTSCCPAWIKYAETKHPEFINKNISSCKSPLQMFGAVIDELYGNCLLYTSPVPAEIVHIKREVLGREKACRTKNEEVGCGTESRCV